MNYQTLREECCEANRRLPALGLAALTFGNVSCLDRPRGVFAIKPSGVAYAALTARDIVILDLDGQVVDGRLRPSSDTPTHRRLFLAFNHIRAVAHTHSRHATAFAQARRAIPCLGTTHADYFHGAVPVTRPLTAAEIRGDYEWATGSVIVERFRKLDPAAVSGALVSGHGPFVWGGSGAAAVETAFALELVAGLARETLTLNPRAATVSAALRDKHFLRKHGAQAYYGQPADGGRLSNQTTKQTKIKQP
ncbi:MAG: L-ribulose-5-phosphate 4-epimerase AraD [Verrucomicrobiales bacterium]|jgi:L-ribulose-5-phosphate 4-epimerase|nr:L-ribulose-5-phosphate 4-epimerase AraD [Verrucomicrobiales bacterium]